MSINFPWSKELSAFNSAKETKKEAEKKEKRIAILRAKATEALKPQPKSDDKPKRTARKNARAAIKSACMTLSQQFAAWLSNEENGLTYLMELRAEEGGKGNGYCATAPSFFSSAIDAEGKERAHYSLMLSFLSAHMTEGERQRIANGGIVDISALFHRAAKVRTLRSDTGVIYLTFRDYLSLFVGGKLTEASMVDGKKIYRLKKWKDVSYADLVHGRKVLGLKEATYPALPA